MKQVLIVGCGDLGTGTGLALAAEGHQVWGVRRRPEEIPAPINPLAGDFSHPDDLPDFPRELDTVYFIATPDEYNDAGYRAAYVDGLANVLERLESDGLSPRRVIFVSSTGVYGQNDGSWVEEDSAAEPTRFSGRRLLEAERMLAEHRFPSVVVRFAGIYGPGRDGLIRRVREGGTAADKPPRYTNRIHRDDCVGVLCHLFSLPTPQPLYLGVDDNPCPQTEVMDGIAEILNLSRPPRETNSRGQNKRCDNSRLRASGYQLRYPDWRAGYRALLEG